MEEQVKEYINKYPIEIINLFNEIRTIIYDSVSCDIKETLWAKIPSYYVNDSFIRLIPFKDHINIEAKAINDFIKELKDYKITPKGMLQIYIDENIPINYLNNIFKDTLNK